MTHGEEEVFFPFSMADIHSFDAWRESENTELLQLVEVPSVVAPFQPLLLDYIEDISRNSQL